MGFLFWIVVGLLIVSIVVYLSSLRTRRRLPVIELPEGESLPITPLQRYSGLTLITVATFSAIAAAIVIYHGPQVWWDNDSVRLTVTFLLLAGLVAYLIFIITISAMEKRGDGSFDERDSSILASSYAGVGGAMMTVIAIWMVALTETFHDTGLVPTYFLYLIFWSCVMTNVIASIAGILLAYRRV